MFIGYYKNIDLSKEFYSIKSESLNFPMQVVYKGDRYLLGKTIQIASKSHENNIKKTAERYGIEYDVRIDFDIT